MSPAPRRTGRRGSVAAAAAVLALAVGGTSALAAGLAQGSDGPDAPPLTVPSTAPSEAVAAQEPSAAAGAAPLPAPAAAPPAPVPADATTLDVPTMPRSRPVSLSIPSIGIADSGPLVDLGKLADGTLEVPEDPLQAGWFEPGPAPGQFGPSVIAGHVDGGRAPGIFYRLGQLRPGAIVEVAREDGSTARFVVDRVERYPKDQFPTVAVYGDTSHRSELRLITCGGAFDDRTGHYVDNVVAYAHLL